MPSSFHAFITVSLLMLSIFSNCFASDEKNSLTVWPEHKPKYTDSFLPAAIQVLLVQTDRLETLRNESVYNTTEDSFLYDKNLDKTEIDTPTWVRKEIVTLDQANSSLDIENLKDECNNSTNQNATSQQTTNEENESDYNLSESIKMLGDLRDTLTVDAKRQGLSRNQGYSNELLKSLAETSKLTSRNQLTIILDRMLEQRDIKRKESVEMTKTVLGKLEDVESPLSRTLEIIPSFLFSFQTVSFHVPILCIFELLMKNIILNKRD